MIVEKDRDKKRDKYHDKSYSREGEDVESMVGRVLELLIDPPDASDIEYRLNEKHNPKYRLMDKIEDNQKCEVDKRKKEHVECVAFSIGKRIL